MKKNSLIIGLAFSLSITTLGFANDSSSCSAVSESKCFMMPTTQDSRANLTWIGPVCCRATDNMKADLSSQNSRHGVIATGKATATQIGTITTVYSEKGSDSRVATIAVTR